LGLAFGELKRFSANWITESLIKVMADQLTDQATQ
jgi:hypothetical protein